MSLARRVPAPFARVASALALSLASLWPSLARAQAVAAPGLAESIGDRIVRFHADARARDAAAPSIALEHPRPALGPAPADFPVRPLFASERGGRIVTLEVEPGTSLYGTGEVAGPLQRNGRVTMAWNTDAYAFNDATPALYQSHPVGAGGARATAAPTACFADTPGKLVIDLTDRIEFRAAGPAFPVIVIERESPAGVLTALAELTGHMPMPPRWALGYQQCRYSYTPDREVLPHRARVPQAAPSRATCCGWTSTTWTGTARSRSTPSASPTRGR